MRINIQNLQNLELAESLRIYRPVALNELSQLRLFMYCIPSTWLHTRFYGPWMFLCSVMGIVLSIVIGIVKYRVSWDTTDIVTSQACAACLAGTIGT